MATDTVSEGSPGGGYRFRPLTEDDLPLLGRWLAESHVRRWWGEPAHELDLIREVMAAPAAEAWLVESEAGPIAYLQAYDGAAEGMGWPGLPPGCWGLDTFIGPPEATGHGHGSAFLRQFGDRLLARPEVACLAVDPDPDNAKAIRSFEKAGFVAEGRIATPDGPSLLMIRRPEVC